VRGQNFFPETEGSEKLMSEQKPMSEQKSEDVSTAVPHDDVETVTLFIDGANLYASAKLLGLNIDFRRLLREFQSRGDVLGAFYYTSVIEDQEYSSLRPLLDWLSHNGYSVVTKPTEEFVDANGQRRLKGNMDIELTVAAMEIAPRIKRMVLFSGDSDFTALVEAMQRCGVRVTVVSTVAMVADRLRQQADQFIDLADDLSISVSEEQCAAMLEARGRLKH
jgi:uncharacterized LabA/DUF88 family protein